MLIAIALDDAWFLGVLSSRIHVTWALAAGGRLGVGNDPRYNKSRCFETFPFPDASQAQQARIRAIAERLDAHRKRQQALHPRLTLTGMYNVLEKLRAGEPLTAREQAIHEQGLVSVLRQLHDELDAAVFDAYGWPTDLEDEAILQRLVDLNAARAAEEAAGRVRWLRPDYQAPDEAPAQAALLETANAPGRSERPGTHPTRRQWPASLPEQAQAVRAALAAAAGPVDAGTLAALFGRRTQKRLAQISELLEMLAALGQARAVGDGRYVGV
jgi:hypothetical protein